jgi:hypothetical protein
MGDGHLQRLLPRHRELQLFEITGVVGGMMFMNEAECVLRLILDVLLLFVHLCICIAVSPRWKLSVTAGCYLHVILP